MHSQAVTGLDTLDTLGSLDNGGNGKYVTCCSCGTTTAGKPSDRPADSEPRLAARVGRSWAGGVAAMLVECGYLVVLQKVPSEGS